MRLLSILLMRLVAVVALCLACATAWVMVDTHRAIDRETAASAARIGQHLEALYWQKLVWRDGIQKDSLLPLPEWETLATQSVISPGVCVTFAPPGGDKRTLCSQVEALGQLPPEWFSYIYSGVFGPHETIRNFLSVRNQSAGTIETQADSGAALRLAWRRASMLTGIAAALAGAIAVLAAVMIGHALLPATAIIQALHRLERGDLTVRLPLLASGEFSHIARAVNSLAEKLFQTNAERSALTARLFQVQEDERRALARDLHDEFGQSLTATKALAALIEASALPDREDIAADARAIARTQNHMMDTLRSTLVRLRSQNIEELGLEASLRQLIADCNSQSASQTHFKLDFVGQIAALQKRIAVDVYRITQECLTNALRHGQPNEVRVVLAHVENPTGYVELTIEDDGGGDIAHFKPGHGHGLLGIKERLAALGGKLSISNAARGIRVSANIPLKFAGGPGTPSGAYA